ncbi:MAG: hypothetical protein ACYS6W_18380 [Planctomycetota bacterium]|jgi:hypothetical protein
MATTIKQILEWPVGYKSGGFVLVVKVAKKKWNVGDQWFQRVMFADGAGDEIFGEILLNGNNGIQRNVPLRLIHAERRICDVNNKPVPALFVSQWKDDRPVMSEPDILNDFESWQAARQDEIRGKVRHGIVCAMIRSTPANGDWPEPETAQKDFIHKWVDFIMTGA